MMEASISLTPPLSRDAPTLDRLRDVLFAFMIVMLATVVVRAEVLLQDWMPDILAMPEDAVVVTDRSIGSSVRMFAIETTANVATLFADWEASLDAAGFAVEQSTEEGLETSIQFSGPGIANAKIIVAPTSGDDRSVISFDATLN